MKNKELNLAWLIDVAVPEDGRVKDKELEKVEKYQDLERELIENLEYICGSCSH